MSDFENRRLCLTRRSIVAGALAAGTQALAPVGAFASNNSLAATRSHRMDIERFVEDCVAANQEQSAQAAVTEVLGRAVSDPNAVLAALGDPERAGLKVLLSSPTLTIFAATWTPRMNLMPHDHLMWASIGIYTGREDNIFWQRTAQGIRAFGADALFQKDTAMLPVDALHSVTNPLLRFTGGLHVYGGDFFGTQRSQWNPETLQEEPSDGAVIRGIFERENQRLGL